MKTTALAAATFGIAAGAAQAGGLDRSYTPVDLIFEKGNYAELSFGYTDPDLTGNDVLGNAISNVGGSFGIAGAGLKLDFGDKLSFGLIYDQPYGSDILYGGNPATTMLAGTRAKTESNALTALLKYRATDRFSVYGGPRLLHAEGEVSLSGLAYGPFSGYDVNFASDNGVGFVAGAAYEIPDIAFRASLTYHSAIDLGMVTTETFPATAPVPVPTTVPLTTGNTDVEVPQSIELALQTGIAKNTLAFGSIRWSEWEAFTLTPPAFGTNLAQIDNATTYELGLGRRFTEKFSASISARYEAGGDDDLVSPLAPTNGQTSLSIGGEYQLTEAVSLSGGIRYTWLGDALPETGTPDTQRATFVNNDAISAGLKLGVHF
ncbi:OmpP1/FadL family transporter [Roseovarius sp. SYSU LYC5161]|uniref:OmpP1/FadL family transporter n=1 Tax=Roseovarius halophilus (ex Wu et al. 2025) TaxID=3376060 RepID=UPI00287224D7|nr:outer membrane beta-barrel protein [Roseovarius sp.]